MAADLALVPPFIFVLFAFVIGACVGSFLNVCIARWPSLQSVISPPSRCPRCGRGIRAWENIPVLSWVLLRGKCAGCALPISPMYPLVELASALLVAGFVWWHGPTWEAVRASVFALILLGIAVADAREMIIPDEFSLGGTVLGFALTPLATGMPMVALPAGLCVGTALAYLAWEGTLDTQEPGARRRPLLIALSLAVVAAGLWFVPELRPMSWAAIAGFGSLWLVGVVGSWMAKRDAMGGGDLKLMLMVGAFTSLSGIAITVLLGAVLGTLVFLPVALLKKEQHMELPFGVFLAPAALLAYVAGERIVQWYLRVSGLA